MKPEAVKNPLEPFRSLWRLVGNSSFLPVLLMVMLLHAGVLMITPAIAGLVATLDGGSTSASATAVVFASIGIAGAISSIGMGWLAGRIGIRRLFIVAAAAAAVASLGPFFAHGIVEFTLLAGLVALFQGGLGGLLQGLIASKTPPGLHGAAFGASQVAHSIGTALGPMVGGAAVVLFGFRSVFLVNVGLFTIVLVLALVVITTSATSSTASREQAE